MISVLAWNIKKFGNNRSEADLKEIVCYIQEYNPDIITLFELVGNQGYRFVEENFPDHIFYMTYGQQSQEMMIGVRRNLKAFFTQKDEFQSGDIHLRPGALVTVTQGNIPYNFLFLHLKSSNVPKGLGLRDDVFKQVCKLKKKLDVLSKEESRFIVCGDLNILGMQYPFEHSIDPAIELKKIEKDLSRVKITRIEKDNAVTWTSSSDRFPDADLDHVFSTSSVKVSAKGRKSVVVDGWNRFERQSEQFRHFVRHISDHCLLYFEVE